MSVTIKTTADELCWKSEHGFVYRMGQSRRTCPDLSLLNPQRPLNHLDTILDPPSSCHMQPTSKHCWLQCPDRFHIGLFTFIPEASSPCAGNRNPLQSSKWTPNFQSLFFFFPIQQTPTARAIFLHHTLFRDCPLLLRFKLRELYKAHMIWFLPPFYSHLHQCSSPKLF